MTKKYFFVKGENPETKSKFVSICTNVDFIDVCKMYREKGLHVDSITILCQAKADEPICINSSRYGITNDREYVIDYMTNCAKPNILYNQSINSITNSIPILETDNSIDIDALDIGEYNFDKIDLPIQTYHVRKDFGINIFPTINGKIKTVIFSKNTLVFVKNDPNQDKVYIRIFDNDKELYYLSMNRDDILGIGKDYLIMTIIIR